MSAVRVFRDLRLNLKVTLTLTAVFVSIAAVFLAVLLYYQREQRTSVLALKRDVVATLHENFSREFVHYILQENEQSLAFHLANLASHNGVEGTWIQAPSMGIVLTTDRRVISRVLGTVEGQAGSNTGEDAVLVLRQSDGKAVRAYSAASRVRTLDPPRDFELPAYLVNPQESEVAFLATHPRVTVMSYRGALMAAEDRFGDLHIHYSLADLESTEKLTRRMFTGLILTIFLLLLVLLNLLISRIVIRPVRKILAAMRRASTGDLEQKLRVGSQDEIGTIAESFNQMVHDLKASKDEIEEYSHNLERRVLDRTQKLRESESNLRNLKNYLATVIANVETGVISVDDRGEVTTFNERAGEILDLQVQSVEGRPLEEILTRGETLRLLEFLRPVLSGQKDERRGQLTLRLPEKRRTLSVVASALFGAGDRDPKTGDPKSGGEVDSAQDGHTGHRIGTVIVFEDVTQLISSQRLEAWKEAVEKVIHEIKNPLTPISLAAQRVRSAYSEDRENFEEIFLWGSKTILDSVTSLKNLITEFSSFYRLPKVVLRPQSVNRLVEETLSLYNESPAENVTVVRQLARDDPEVEADAEQLKRVLFNVVKNAIESLAGRKGQVTVATSGPDAAGWVRISIRDDGEGIEDVEKIFEPYYTTKVKGTGLGLIISRQIVEEHGGEIRVRSAVGQGTEVDILLPCSRGPKPHRSRTESAS